MSSKLQDKNRLIAIGDIHGHSVALEAVLRAIEPRGGDVIVTLGDYVNRGPDAKGVIDCLLQLRERCELIPILGNHDEMLVDARGNRHAEDRFMASGGWETVLSYGSTSLKTIPDSHWEFFESCCNFHVTESFAFTHANFCRYTPFTQQVSAILRWTGIDEMEICNHESGKVAIVGHSAGKDVRDFGTCVCIDTGCGFGGLLTAYEPASGRRWQVTESGKLVSETDLL